MRQTIDDIKE